MAEPQDIPFNVSLPLLGVGAFTLLLSFCFCCYLWRLKKNAQREEAGFVTKKFNPRGRNQRNETCPVCLEDFIPKEKIAVCDCKHVFHSKCLLQWLEHRNNCPLCKAPVRNSARENTGLIRPTVASGSSTV
ncbi:RING finger protein 24 [Aplysia californica]|uniref:RING finger protein 24 n=1 Tax=Aplysia californica TaxID=6500 RepID=A0ABM0ZWN6_APLCA|nr:RING finger protein 24 [Aplysia californica]XP_012936058.1 RING finger protein 24 [Aplysia californica]XP_012936062.1 RING finger protein 24 [Aplysia californica]XP_012936064.1 RING finger protein 24 [Aplysia californica]